MKPYALSLGALILPGLLLAAPVEVNGRWTGELEMEGKSHTLVIEISGYSGQHQAIYATDDRASKSFKTVEDGPAGLKLVTTGGSFFAGRIQEETYTGRYQHDAKRSGTFRARRAPATIPAVALDGAYRASTGEVWVVSRSDAGLFLGNTTNGWARALRPAGPDRYVFGNTLLDEKSTAGTVEFTGNGRLTATMGGQAGFSGTRVPFTEEAIRFENEGSVLSGMLTLPAGPGPFPAVVLLHGSGPQVGGEPWSHALVADGFAVLSFDKRGSGKSTGPDWRASFETYANDALAAIAVLHRRKDIKPDHIGLYGPSQGGYIALLAASKSTDVGFVIIRSTAAIPPFQQEEYRLGKLLEIQGYSAADVAAARAFVHTKFNTPVTGDWAAYESVADRARSEKWFETMGGSPAREHPAHEFWRQNGRFDPLPLLARLHIPILWLTPEFDESSPVPETVAALKSAPGEIAHLIIPGADHGMLATSGFHVTDENLAGSPGLAPEFLPSIRRWLANNAR